MKRSLRGLWMLLGAGVLAAGPVAQSEAPEDVLIRLSDTMRAIRTLDTVFVQTKHLALFDQEIVMHGKVYLEKPDRLAWHVVRPVRYTLIMDGRSIRQWDADSGQVSRMSLRANPAMQMAADQMRRWFAGDYVRMRADYRIMQHGESPIVLTFEPLDDNPAAGFIERVTVQFTRDERYLDSITILEQGGDRAELRFSDTRLDQELPPAAWDLRARMELE